MTSQGTRAFGCQRAPAGMRWLKAEPQKRQEAFGHHVRGNLRRDRNQNRAPEIGQEMPQKNTVFGDSLRARSLDIGLLGLS